MPAIQELPIELLTYALTLALIVHPCPSHILCVCKRWEVIATPTLHKDIRFTRISQLEALTRSAGSPRRNPPVPTSITFAKTINESYYIFSKIQSLFQAINLSNLEVVKVNVHSERGDVSVFDALKLINPLVFEWLSPDSKNQVSLSLTGTAVRAFVLACATRWTRLQRIKLTGLTCADDSIFDAFDGAVQPNLTHIEIGQAIEVKPVSVVSTLARLPNLVEAKLVDVYMDSIWGKRLRMEDLRKAFEAREKDPALEKENEGELVWSDVSQKMKCLVRDQRLQGGDRGEDMEVD